MCIVSRLSMGHVYIRTSYALLGFDKIPYHFISDFYFTFDLDVFIVLDMYVNQVLSIFYLFYVYYGLC